MMDYTLQINKHVGAKYTYFDFANPGHFTRYCNNYNTKLFLERCEFLLNEFHRTLRFCTQKVLSQVPTLK